MSRFFKILTFFVLLFAVFTVPAQALTFDLLAPTGTLTRGQDVKFTVNIDTEGESLTTSSIGMTYDTQYLEYVSAVPGNTFTTVTADVQGAGKLVITGTKAAGYSGTGSFAVVTFKLIAQQAGSTTLCALFNPNTPTATPVPAGPTSTPAPTSLPVTGSFDRSLKGATLGMVFFALSALGFVIFRKI